MNRYVIGFTWYKTSTPEQMIYINRIEVGEKNKVTWTEHNWTQHESEIMTNPAGDFYFNANRKRINLNKIIFMATKIPMPTLTSRSFGIVTKSWRVEESSEKDPERTTGMFGIVPEEWEPAESSENETKSCKIEPGEIQ